MLHFQRPIAAEVPFQLACQRRVIYYRLSAAGALARPPIVASPNDDGDATMEQVQSAIGI